MKRINYRHYIAITITLGFIACIFFFPNSLGRLVESVRDFGLSVAYYFCEIFQIDHNISPTVNNYPKIPFFDFLRPSSPSAPSVPIPDNFNDFKNNWSDYWKLFVSKDNFLSYLSSIAYGLKYISYALLLLLPAVLLLWLLFRRYLKRTNTDHGKESKPLKAFKRLSDVTYRPVKRFLGGFIDFIKTTPVYLKIWACIWAFYFNLFTIVIEFIAFYLYFVVSFDFGSIYRQIYKFFFDIWTIIDFLPLWSLLLAGIIGLEYMSRNIGYNELYHRERRNRGFGNERGVVTVVYGEMGAGKTALITDMSLSADVELRDMAFEIILESDLKFPNFPWINLEDELKKAILFHVVYDLWSCRRWLKKKYRRWLKSPCREKIFGYDYERYGLTYNNALEVADVWQVLDDYACAFVIYIRQRSLIVSNFSIRSDNFISDLGNFPLWNADFFKRDSRLIDSFSRHSHIIDYDMLRLGKVMIENNPNKNAFGFGVYVISEIDKERKNAPELKDVKADSEQCNQKNDLFNVLLKMSRHACVVANRVFIKIFADLQRPESLGADARELGEVVYIDGNKEKTLTLPFFAPFYFFELFYLWTKPKFDNLYTRYRYQRSDNTLFMYLLKNITSAMQHHYERICNTFGSTVLNLEVESGRMNGNVKKRKYFRQDKKIWSGRYATNCLSGIFETRAEINRIGIDDLPEYAAKMATNEELSLQHSHFQNDLAKAMEKSSISEKTFVTKPEPIKFDGYDPSDIPGFND